MKMDTQTIILAVIFSAVVIFGLLQSCTYEYNTTNNYNYQPVKKTNLNPKEEEFLDLVNSHRDSLHLPLLIPELLASQICLNRNLLDISNNVPPSHDGWYEMVMACKCDGDIGDQIEANNYETALGLFNAYMASPEHKRAIEMEDRTHIGISFIQRRNYCLILKY